MGLPPPWVGLPRLLGDPSLSLDGKGVNTTTVQLTEQLHFVLWTLHQDRADRVQVVVVAAAQRAGPGLRDLEKEGQSVDADSKGRLFPSHFPSPAGQPQAPRPVSDWPKE